MASVLLAERVKRRDGGVRGFRSEPGAHDYHREGLKLAAVAAVGLETDQCAGELITDVRFS